MEQVANNMFDLNASTSSERFRCASEFVARLVDEPPSANNSARFASGAFAQEANQDNYTLFPANNSASLHTDAGSSKLRALWSAMETGPGPVGSLRANASPHFLGSSDQFHSFDERLAFTPHKLPGDLVFGDGASQFRITHSEGQPFAVSPFSTEWSSAADRDDLVPPSLVSPPNSVSVSPRTGGQRDPLPTFRRRDDAERRPPAPPRNTAFAMQRASQFTPHSLVSDSTVNSPCDDSLFPRAASFSACNTSRYYPQNQHGDRLFKPIEIETGAPQCVPHAELFYEAVESPSSAQLSGGSGRNPYFARAGNASNASYGELSDVEYATSTSTPVDHDAERGGSFTVGSMSSVGSGSVSNARSQAAAAWALPDTHAPAPMLAARRNNNPRNQKSRYPFSTPSGEEPCENDLNCSPSSDSVATLASASRTQLVPNSNAYSNPYELVAMDSLPIARLAAQSSLMPSEEPFASLLAAAAAASVNNPFLPLPFTNVSIANALGAQAAQRAGVQARMDRSDRSATNGARPINPPGTKVRSSAANELHAKLEECYEQFRLLEKERKKIEAELARQNPGKRISAACLTPGGTPLMAAAAQAAASANGARMPNNPSRIDRLVAESLREHQRAVELVSQIDRLRGEPLPANIRSSIERWLDGIKKVQARRKEEIVNTANRQRSGASRTNDEKDVIALGVAVGELTLHKRQMRTAIWCAMQLCLAPTSK